LKTALRTTSCNKRNLSHIRQARDEPFCPVGCIGGHCNLHSAEPYLPVDRPGCPPSVVGGREWGGSWGRLIRRYLITFLIAVGRCHEVLYDRRVRQRNSFHQISLLRDHLLPIHNWRSARAEEPSCLFSFGISHSPFCSGFDLVFRTGETHSGSERPAHAAEPVRDTYDLTYDRFGSD
jgi:hypothetical protein